MSALKRYATWTAVLAGIVVATGCGNGEAQQTAAAEPAAEETAGRVINVEVVTVVTRPFEEFVTLTGELEAARDIAVAAEESGVIREVFVPKGRRVTAGQPIARIDDSVLRAQFEQARSEATLARETWERQQRLWEDERIGTEIAYLRARYGAETADANARVLAARLERTVIRAPIAGILDDRMVEVGSMVSPGTPVARIVDTDPVEVTAGVPERYAGEIRTGAAVRVTIDHLGGGALEGRADFVGTTLDARTRTFPVEFTVRNPNGVLKPGMVATIALQRRTIGDALMVPQQAVQRGANGYLVYVVREADGQTYAETRPVQPGARSEQMVVIDSGLEEGDRVIVVGQQQVANGDRVRVTERTEVVDEQ